MPGLLIFVLSLWIGLFASNEAIGRPVADFANEYPHSRTSTPEAVAT